MVRISSARLDMENARIDGAVIRDYGETLVGGASGTNTTSTYTVDLSTGNVFNLILNADCTFTFSNPTATGTSCSFTLFLKQDDTGSWEVTWPASVKWPSATPPTISSAARQQDIYYFSTVDGGTTWLASTAAQNVKTGPQSAIDVVTRFGLTTGLKICLDTGDSSSYTSGQSWLDRSGNGYDFFRGTTSGSDASDPTFNGVAGTLSPSAYWSFDGGDYFTYDTTNETWMQNLHKDNALWTYWGWWYFASTSSNNKMWGTRGATGGTNTGVVLTMGTGNFNLSIANNGTGINNFANSGLPSNNTWHFCAVCIDEAGGAAASLLMVDSSVTTFDGAYSGPSTGNASNTLQIGAGGANNAPIANNSRHAISCFYEGVILTQAQLLSIYNATRDRFGV